MKSIKIISLVLSFVLLLAAIITISVSAESGSSSYVPDPEISGGAGTGGGLVIPTTAPSTAPTTTPTTVPTTAPTTTPTTVPTTAPTATPTTAPTVHTHNWTTNTVSENGIAKKVTTCSGCDETEEIEIFRYSADNYTVSITNGSSISLIRYATGEYTTSSEIKNASDVVTLLSSSVANATQNNVFSREMAKEGKYSFYVRMIDNTEAIFTIDLNQFTQKLSAYDLNLTVHNLYGVKDITFATGHYTTYRDTKNAGVLISNIEFEGARSYTRVMGEAGETTVCVRYTDSTRANEFYYIVLTPPNPTLEVDGLSIKISGLEDVKTIKRVYGTYNNYSDMKAASGIITYGRNLIDTETNTLSAQLILEGDMTIAVQYKSGYVKLFHVTIEQKRPTVTQEGNKLTLGGLNDLYIIRYAKGVYNKANEIKYAKGSQYVKGDFETKEFVLDPGTYTFLVQYNEGSQNIFTVTIQ